MFGLDSVGHLAAQLVRLALLVSSRMYVILIDFGYLICTSAPACTAIADVARVGDDSQLGLSACVCEYQLEVALGAGRGVCLRRRSGFRSLKLCMY